MKKDVIYIDIEDDITSVIEKLKASSEKIVALVPPKGSSILQSVVNLRLLHRAANKVGKQPVVVTNNQALTALAGGIGLYVAKTLQSKPVVPAEADLEGEAEAVEVSDDIGSLEPSDVAGDDEVELSSDELAALATTNQPDGTQAAKKPAKAKGKKKKVPNFNSFRKKALIIGGVLVLLLIVLLAIFGRTKSNIVIRAETSPIDVALTATFDAKASETDPSSNLLKAQSQEIKKTLTHDFTPTGKRDVGEKATGTVTFSTGAISSLGTTIPAGTRLRTANDVTFVTNSSVTITLSNYNGAPVGVTAAERGTKHNGASGSLSGAPDNISASLNSPTSGGTSRTITIVSQADIDRARTQLDQQDEAEIKKELREGFEGRVKIFEDSFKASTGQIRSEPAVGQQANEGRLSAEATYTMLAVSEDDLKAVLDAYITSEMPDKDKQRVYENGFENATFERVDSTATRGRYRIASLGQYGPRFDIEALKKEVSGKKIGEVRSYLQELPGVKGVDIGLTPFWARQLPGADRITIKLDVDENASS